MLAKNIIAGKESSAKGTKIYQRLNPSNGDLVSEYRESNPSVINEAIDYAETALYEGKWSTNPKLRAHILHRIYELILNNVNELAKIQSMETGKILKDSVAEIKTASDIFDFYSGVARSLYGKTLVPEEGLISITFREPVGVVAIIVPWNSPIVLLARSLAPALAAGNSVIVKPSSLTPLTIYKFIKLMLDNSPEIPLGVLNLIQGSGSRVGRDLILSPKVNMVSFTGSTETGKQIMKDSSMTVKRLSLELGGKSPNIIFSDANIENAVLGAIKGSMFGSATQICFAGTRLLVQQEIHEKFISRVKELLKGMKVGNALDNDVSVGPVVSAEQHKKVLDFIEYGKENSNLLSGGYKLKGGEYAKGYYIPPTVFDHVDPNSKIAQDEIFGPVISIIPFSTKDDAIELANRTKYGLSAAVWTTNINTALDVAKRIKAGTVWVNTYGKMLSETESGGYKQSGIGRSRGVIGLESYTELKNIVIEA